MAFLQSLGNFSQPLIRCREYFESLRVSTAALKNANMDSAIDHPRPGHLQTVRNSAVGTPYDMTVGQSNSGAAGMANSHLTDNQDDDFSMVNMDQMIIDYSSSSQLFTDPLFCDINFGQFNMR